VVVGARLLEEGEEEASLSFVGQGEQEVVFPLLVALEEVAIPLLVVMVAEVIHGLVDLVVEVPCPFLEGQVGAVSLEALAEELSFSSSSMAVEMAYTSRPSPKDLEAYPYQLLGSKLAQSSLQHLA
jgi:hypothetical protein